MAMRKRCGEGRMRVTKYSTTNRRQIEAEPKPGIAELWDMKSQAVKQLSEFGIKRHQKPTPILQRLSAEGEKIVFPGSAPLNMGSCPVQA